jgi:hypothetical protein
LCVLVLGVAVRLRIVQYVIPVQLAFQLG